MAMEIERSRRLRDKEGGAAPATAIVVNNGSSSSKGSNVKYEENEDPQRMSLDGVNHLPVPPPPPAAATALASSTSTAVTTPEVELDITPSSSSSPTITIQITVGPHAPSTYTIHPKPNTPCVIGRSKGKKFTKNGISLYKDQEVSTTHGKFLVVMEESANEEVLLDDDVDDDNDNADDNGAAAVAGASNSSSRMKILRPRYYYIDVGSTNGTMYNGVALVPNVKLELKHGMEIKVGNSLLQMEIL
jgi:hypothetical protein